MPDDLERLMAKVRKDPATGCWLWTGARAGRGYAEGRGYSAFRLHGRLTSGHRASYEILRGPIPAGLTIDHLCRNGLCVNPEHLEAVTDAENNRRGDGVRGQHLRADTCPQGHPYDEANTYRRPGGGRGCRKCRSAVVQRRKAALRSAQPAPR